MLPIYIAFAYYLLLTRVIPGLYENWKRSRQLRLKNRAIIFSRYPTPGNTKTRLIPTLGPAGAAGLQLLMTDHLVRVLKRACLNVKQLCVEIRYFGGSPLEMNYWTGKHQDPLITHREQGGEDLGQKMGNAMKDAFNEGASNVVIVGSDIPGISTDILSEAFELLSQPEYDVILGPATDGGYYAVGMSSGACKAIDELFCGMDWGTERVLEQQMTVGKKLGLKMKLLSQSLNDVDTADDLHVVQKYIGISKDDIVRPRWSIVMPVLNESQNLDKVITSLIEVKVIFECNDVKSVKNADSPERLEIIIADGGSNDDSKEIIDQIKEKFKSTGTVIKFLECIQKGRGNQLNEGAKESCNKLLLFVHADSQLPPHYDTTAWHMLMRPGVAAGAFNFGLDVVHNEEKRKTVSWWFLQQMKLLEWGTRRRAVNMELPYGDQGLFLWRRTFDNVGGYPPYRLMEDYEMITKLKREGHIGIVDGPPLLTSARRWQKHGYLKITGFNTFIITAYKCGVHPDTLATWYYGK